MAKQKRTSHPSAFQSIDGAVLSWVVGGRLIPRTGISPEVKAGMTSLVKGIEEYKAVKTQADAQQQGMMQQVMQRMMG